MNTLVEGQVGDLTNAGSDDGLAGWTIIGEADGTVTPVDSGGVTTVRLQSLTGQPVGIEQWFDGYSYNAAQAIVSAETPTGTNVILEVFRLDGTQVDIRSEPVDFFQGWVSTGGVGWPSGTEDVLLYRLTTTGTGALLVDTAITGLSP